MKKLSPVLIWSLIASIFILVVVIVLGVGGFAKSVDTKKGLFGKAWKDGEELEEQLTKADGSGSGDKGLFGDIYSSAKDDAESEPQGPDFPDDILEIESKSGKLLIIRKPSAISNSYVTMSESPVDRRLDLTFSRAGAITGASDFPIARLAGDKVYETQNLTPVTYVSGLADKLPRYFGVPDGEDAGQPDELSDDQQPAEKPDAQSVKAEDPAAAGHDKNFAFNMPEDADFLAAVSVDVSFERNETTLSLQFYDTYEFEMWDDGTFVYIECYRPRELYDRIVIIDAGHGGVDPGAITPGEEVPEKEINLAIVECLKRYLSRMKNIKFYYTRLDERTVTHSQRLELANNLQADLMLSIHCNSSESSSMSGIEVLYASCVPASARFATQFCIAGANATGFRNRGIVPRDNVMLLRDTLVPSVIVECGFLSNSKERAFLSKPENQDAIAAEIFKALDELMK